MNAKLIIAVTGGGRSPSRALERTEGGDVEVKSAKALDWTGWTKTEKPVDRERPFHRINCPTMNEGELGPPVDTNKFRVSGRGYDCGCRIPTEIPVVSLKERVAMAFGKEPRALIRTVPSWVPVKVTNPGTNQVEDVLEPQEVEGVLVRSYQTWTDFPLFQWHRWYDWNFMIVPAPGYGYLRGGANTAPRIEGEPITKDGLLQALRSGQFSSKELTREVSRRDTDFFLRPDSEAELRSAGATSELIETIRQHGGKSGFTQIAVRDFDGTGVDSMECEFDCGMFGSRFRDISSPQSFGPMFESDWAWPMAGSYLWATGKWIYDCGHPTTDEKTGPNPGLTRTELHPCRALASARWEAVNFDENGKLFVPAIQFMFFATRLGGYTDEEQPGTLPTQDIEFIVDLPKLDVHLGPFPIGHTPEFPHNTIQLPKLLKKVEFLPFSNAINKTSATKLATSTIEPIVEPIRRKDDPGAPPQQVKVTIPFASGIPASDDYYGVILSLGWLDVDFTQARRVKKVRVTLQSVRVGSDVHDATIFKGSGEWQVRAGVNGRWFQKRKEDIEPGEEIPLNNVVDFFLADDDAVAVAAHGEETDLVHDVYKDRTDGGRVLKLPTTLRVPIPVIGPVIGRNSRPLKYFADCLHGDLKLGRTIVTAMEDDMFWTFGDESNPLGRIDPFHRTSVGDKENPLPISRVNGRVDLVQTALPSKEVGKSAELAENPNGVDYLLVYSIEASDQI